MSDIVERLREPNRGKTEWEAADEITRLRKALKDILGMSSAFKGPVKGQPYTHHSVEFVLQQARAALSREGRRRDSL